MRKNVKCLLALGLVFALLLCGCSQNSGVTVSVQSVAMLTGQGAVGLMDRYAGLVEAGQTITIEKDQDMEVKEILVSVGDKVKTGDILFTYDNETLGLELEKKQLELEQLKVSIETKGQQISTLEKDKAKASKSDQLDYTLQIQELQVDISEANLNVTAKEKEIERVQNLLEQSEVRATVDGSVQTINETGATDEYGNQQPFMTLAQSGDYRIKGTINEQNAMSLMPGMPVVIRSRVDDTVTWTGMVDRIDTDNPVKDNSQMYYGPSDEMTQSSKYPFYITLDTDEGLMLGQHVYIEPGVEQEQTAQGLLLPAYFVVDAETDPYVWAANNKDRLEKRTVQLGAYDEMNGTYEILSGLTADDFIAFPDETCVAGANVTKYSEENFAEMPMEPGMDEFNGNIEEGFEEDVPDEFVPEDVEEPNAPEDVEGGNAVEEAGPVG